MNFELTSIQKTIFPIEIPTVCKLSGYRNNGSVVTGIEIVIADEMSLVTLDGCVVRLSVVSERANPRKIRVRTVKYFVSKFLLDMAISRFRKGIRPFLEIVWRRLKKKTKFAVNRLPRRGSGPNSNGFITEFQTGIYVYVTTRSLEETKQDGGTLRVPEARTRHAHRARTHLSTVGALGA